MKSTVQVSLRPFSVIKKIVVTMDFSSEGSENGSFKGSQDSTLPEGVATLPAKRSRIQTKPLTYPPPPETGKRAESKAVAAQKPKKIPWWQKKKKATDANENGETKKNVLANTPPK